MFVQSSDKHCMHCLLLSWLLSFIINTLYKTTSPLLTPSKVYKKIDFDQEGPGIRQ